MYSLHKIVIIGGWNPDDRESLQTIAMETTGLKINSVLYLDDAHTIGDEEETAIKEVKDQLYSDMYDEDLSVKVKEVYDGHDAIRRLVKYISKAHDDQLETYFYKADDDTYTELEKALRDVDCNIYLSDFDNLVEYEESKKNIIEIMKTEGLKTDNLIKDSQVSFAYFISVLIERLLSR